MESFYEGWVSRQEQLLDDLLAAPRDRPDLARALVTRVLEHYHEYYNEKAHLAACDVLAVFSPAWLSPHERTFLWIAGWKPSLAFRLLRSAVDLSPEQQRATAELQRATAAEERRLSLEMARLQEAMATPQVLELLRGARNGESLGDGMEEEVESLRRILGSADALRVQTVVALVDILTPVQAVDLFAGAAKFHLRVREWGARRGAA